MKSLLEFKQEAIIVEKPKEEWNRLYLELLDLIKSWGLEDKVNSFKYEWKGSGNSFNKLFELSFLRELIFYVLDIDWRDPIWGDIFDIERISSTPKSYHGSGNDITIETYLFQLEDKSKVLNSLNGNWVFDHYKEVKDFMDQYNDEYLKLFEIKRLFPLEVEIENV